ncbi:hypothetical protein HZH66_009654 [Vespula vulgaris]|uniref:Uncharacterized protein n=1 Tax=Vespula vulgaris TaxID=7454 RepID=A0A834N146_VESVU|nr:hypothetical protein HZH66_009654 [Vespula vulgaris]
MPALPLAASSNGYRANSSPSNKDDILTTHIYVVNASSKDSLGKAESPCLPTASALQSPGTYLLLSRSRHPIAKHMDKLVSCAAWRVAREGSGERERGEGQGQGETTRHASRVQE